MSVKTFFEKVWGFLKAEAPHASSWEQAASTALKVAAPLLNTLITLTAGEAAATKVAGIVAQIQKDMATCAQVLDGTGAYAGGATLTSVLGSIQSNLGGLLADADVKNSTHLTEIESTVNTVIGEVEAVASAMPAGFTPSAPAAMAAAAGATSEAAASEPVPMAPAPHLPNVQNIQK